MLYLIDLFCGFGGVSSGAALAKNVKTIWCVNHDPEAIKSHKANHPDCIHSIEDIRVLDLTEMVALVKRIRKEDPTAKIGLWGSLECTNHSKAKGGLPRDADSRTLAEHLDRYYIAINPDVIFIENVEEFMQWGPLDANGKPVKKYKGCDYQKWVDFAKSFGYEYDYRVLNAADYGAITSRKRYFGQFAKPGYQIVFPEKTHSKTGKDGLKKWNPVKPHLDLTDRGTDVFARKRPYVDKTYARILAGLKKFVNEPSWSFAYYGTGDNLHSLHNPAPTIPTKDRVAVVSVDHFLYRDFKSPTNSSINSPAGSLTTVPKMSLVSVEKFFLYNPQYSSKGSSIENPCFTLIARMDKTPPSVVCMSKDLNFIPIEILPTDTPNMVLVKEFMNEHKISKIYMRMLRIPELLRIQGFSPDYILTGNQDMQKKFIGNAVEVNQAKVILEYSAEMNVNYKIAA